MLPFIAAPQPRTIRIGSQITGVLEFPVIGGLSVLEQREIEESLDLSPFALAAELAVRIQQEQGIQDLILCFQIVTGVGSAESTLTQENRIRYARQIAAIERYSRNDGSKEKLATVTVIIKRIVPDWSQADSLSLSIALFEKIWEFAKLEISLNQLAQEGEVSEEDIKKLLLTLDPSPLTGDKSTGSFSNFGEEIPDSAPTILDASPAG